MINTDKLYQLSRASVLVDYSPGYRLGDFQCADSDYATWLQNDASYYVEQKISQVKLLINRMNADVIAYMALCADSFRISNEEKQVAGLDILFNSVPALKIGKLAIHKQYEEQSYGQFMLFLAIGIASSINENGVACRFITVDADISNNPSVPNFYIKSGFKYNEKMNQGRTASISMRYDVFGDATIIE